MKNTFGYYCVLTAVLVVIVMFVYGCWRMERYCHYKWSYQAMVMVEINRSILPLEKRIQQLEVEVTALKKK